MAEIKTIQKDCLEGRLDVADAISQIDKEVGGITRVSFKNGLTFKVENSAAKYALKSTYAKKKQMDRMHGMAVAAYFKAKENGSMMPGEVHISKYASTKHHMDGIESIRDKYKN